MESLLKGAFQPVWMCQLCLRTPVSDLSGTNTARAMTTRNVKQPAQLRDLAACMREVLPETSRPPIRGRRECRAPNAPAAWQGRKTSRASKQSPRSHRNHPAFPAQWFYGLFRALPGNRAFLPPSLADNSADLTPASGCQDHTTSPSASAPFVFWHPRVHRIPPRVDDVAQRPSVGGMAEDIDLIWASCQVYF